jgi:hypothetical protein
MIFGIIELAFRVKSHGFAQRFARLSQSMLRVFCGHEKAFPAKILIVAADTPARPGSLHRRDNFFETNKARRADRSRPEEAITWS